MSVPQVQFPIAVEAIPGEVKKLTEFIRGLEAELKVARQMLAIVRGGCAHENAKRGYDDRDGFWMNPCPHCGKSE